MAHSTPTNQKPSNAPIFVHSSAGRPVAVRRWWRRPPPPPPLRHWQTATAMAAETESAVAAAATSGYGSGRQQ